jgi:hypothetical protein
MNEGCCSHTDDPHRGNESYRRVLWAVLAINAAMFAVEVAAGVAAGSASHKPTPWISSVMRETTPSAFL